MFTNKDNTVELKVEQALLKLVESDPMFESAKDMSITFTQEIDFIAVDSTKSKLLVNPISGFFRDISDDQYMFVVATMLLTHTNNDVAKAETLDYDDRLCWNIATNIVHTRTVISLGYEPLGQCVNYTLFPDNDAEEIFNIISNEDYNLDDLFITE